MRDAAGGAEGSGLRPAAGWPAGSLARSPVLQCFSPAGGGARAAIRRYTYGDAYPCVADTGTAARSVTGAAWLLATRNK